MRIIEERSNYPQQVASNGFGATSVFLENIFRHHNENHEQLTYIGKEEFMKKEHYLLNEVAKLLGSS